ncbi:uncharacterized protein LOC118408036 [Branchiostoma floridae]|uniref:Uncharacterized protein LOC118408036 n=1 Tax=Branchiostoma floridae TaxID=7739 RepID=A0A9J7KL78_BRAFL|nr:uncharacterized protein LOC118408036 [Branchiostoma floridae]
MKGRTETAQVLLTAGADPNARDENGNTPLHAAANGDNLLCVLELLKAGADSSIRNNGGETAERVSGQASQLFVSKVFQQYKDITPHIPLLTERVGLRWRDLAGRLGFSTDDIDGIVAGVRNHDDQSCCTAMLGQWQQRREGEGILKLQVMEGILSDMGLEDIVHVIHERQDRLVAGLEALVKTQEFITDNMDKDTIVRFTEMRGRSVKQASSSELLMNDLVEYIKTPEDYGYLLQLLEESGQHYLSKEIKTFEPKTSHKEPKVVPLKRRPHHRATVEADESTAKETSTVIIVAPSSTMEQSGSSNSAQIVSSKQRVKLMFVGQTGSGKTSLCLTMIGGEAHTEDVLDRTIGVDIRSYIDQIHGVEYKIYDFGGHDVYHYTHRFFLTHLGLYLLCVDLPGYRSGEFQERVGKWMTSIASHVTKPSLIVVGTKSDEGDAMENIALLERDIKSAETAVRQALEKEIGRCQETLDSREQGLGLRGKDDHFVGLSREEVLDKQTSLQKLLDGRPENLVDVHIVPVSSKRNEGIDVLRAKMTEIVQERIGVSSSRQLPQSWSDFDNLIKQETSKPYLDLNECKRRGNDVGMDITDVLNALEYLHVTGEILFYRHIRGMEDKVFQDPSIILKLFKQLFRHDMAQHLQKAEKLMPTDRQLFLEEGVVSEEFVDAVLPKEAESFQLLLPLMKHFGLCFNRTVTMMANLPIANEDDIAAHWSDTVQEGTKEVKLTMKSLDVNSGHPVGLGESLACRTVLMSEEGRRLVKRNAVINKMGKMDVMYRRLINEEEKRTQQVRTSDKIVDEIYLRADNKEAWRGMKELVKKIKPCLEEYQARLSEDRVTVTGDKKVESIPLEALHKHTGEDLDRIFLGEWAESARQPGVSDSDKMNKYMIDNSLYDLSSKVGQSWRRLATDLGLTRMEIDQIEENRGLTSNTQRAFQVLKQWRKKSAHGPLHYLPQLMGALKNMEEPSLAGDVTAILQEYRHNLPQVTVNPEEHMDIQGVFKWSLPHEGRFYCQKSDLHVITPYPLYVTSVSWSAEPWRYRSDWVPVGPLVHFQFRSDDATEPVEIDFHHIVELADNDMMVACWNDDDEHELLPVEQVKPGHVTALLRKDARVGPVGSRSAVCAALNIGVYMFAFDTHERYGPPHDLKALEEKLATMEQPDLSKAVRRMFMDHISSMDEMDVQPDVATDQEGNTKFCVKLPCKGKYICKDTDIGIVTSCPMTMTYQTEPQPDQWEHQEDWMPVGPVFNIQSDVPEDGPVELLLPHILDLSDYNITDIPEEEAKVVHIADKKEELLPCVITPTHSIFRRCKGTWVFSAVKRALGLEAPRKGLFAMFKSSWASYGVDVKAFIVSNTKGMIKTLQDDLGDLCEEGKTFSLLSSKACTVMPEQTYCLHATVENGNMVAHDPEPPDGIPYEDTLGDGTYPQMFEIIIQSSSDGTAAVKLDARLRPGGQNGHDICKTTKFIELPGTIQPSITSQPPDTSNQGATAAALPTSTLNTLPTEPPSTSQPAGSSNQGPSEPDSTSSALATRPTEPSSTSRPPDLSIHGAAAADLTALVLDTPPTGLMKPRVLLINDEYGTKRGGISTINYQMAQDLTQAGADVSCTVLRASERDMASAANDHVTLIKPFQRADDTREPSLDWLVFDHRIRYPDLPGGVGCIVGHADITDKAARSIKDDRYPQADLVTINHVLPEDTERYKGGRKPMKAWEKEIDILKTSDGAAAVFSVGKRTYSHYSTMYKGDKKPRNHYMYLPRPSTIFADATVDPGGDGQKVVLSIGRVRGVETLKGHTLAAGSLGEVAERINVAWRVCGSSDDVDDYETSRRILEESLKSSKLAPTLLPYRTQEEIMDDMKMAHLVLMPSRSEPFGLVGLEAIAAGIPVLISDQSGLADLIKDLIDKKKCHADRRHRIVETSVNESDHDADVKRWADKILDTLENIQSEFQHAAEFKRELMESRYWEDSRRTFLQACRITGGSAQQ